MFYFSHLNDEYFKKIEINIHEPVVNKEET